MESLSHGLGAVVATVALDRRLGVEHRVVVGRGTDGPALVDPVGSTVLVDRGERLLDEATHAGGGRGTGQDGGTLAPDAVVQMGTTSKTFFPGVRLGWAAGPAEVVARLVAAKQNTDQCAGALGQRLFEEASRRGWIDEQLVASRARYRRKSERLLAALERSLPEDASWTRPQGGFFSWLTLPAGTSATRLAEQAVERGVGVVPGTLFFADGRGDDSVRLSFSMVDEERIDEGVELLASLLTR